MERIIDKVNRLYALLEKGEITKEQYQELRTAALNLLQAVIGMEFLLEGGD